MTREIEVGTPSKITLGGASGLAQFFGGANLTRVDHLNMQIAINADYPEWLRGIAKESGLPRRVMHAEFEFRFVVPPTEAERGVLAAWIVETCHGAWDINNRFVLFEDPEDAVHYRLKWVS